MSGSYTGGIFGTRAFEGGKGGPGQHLADAVDQVRSMFEQRIASVGDGGDVRAAVLELLAEKPMHGYQLISEIDKRSGGAWKPTPGSVYPTLQLLTDEGAVTAEVSEGRKIYSLTESGREEADAAAGGSEPWEASASGEYARLTALPKSGMALAHAAVQVRRTGTPEQVDQAVKVLDEARRKIYAILAQD